MSSIGSGTAGYQPETLQELYFPEIQLVLKTHASLNTIIVDVNIIHLSVLLLYT